MKLTDCKFYIRRFLLDLIMPNRCAFCNKVIGWKEYCCEQCEDKIPYIDEKLCERCGKANCICNDDLGYDKCFSVVWYDDFMKKAVMIYKIESPENFAAFFSDKICEILKKNNCTDFDVVTCTPMSESALRARGYNQAQELGKRIAKTLELPFDGKLLVKFDSKTSQHNLNMKSRKEYARKAFGSNDKKNVRGKSVLLCDDIITTGSTLDACGKILKSMGARCVIGVTACNTNFKTKTDKTV